MPPLPPEPSVAAEASGFSSTSSQSVETAVRALTMSSMIASPSPITLRSISAIRPTISPPAAGTSIGERSGSRASRSSVPYISRTKPEPTTAAIPPSTA